MKENANIPTAFESPCPTLCVYVCVCVCVCVPVCVCAWKVGGKCDRVKCEEDLISMPWSYIMLKVPMRP
jgi:hypothetical protein